MPAIAKVDRDGIVAAALAIVEAQGAAGLTMGALADALGIKAPSLYKRFRDRAALLQAVRTESFRLLGKALARKAGDVHTLAGAYRGFARRRPELYALLFAPGLPSDDDDLSARRAAAEPLFSLLAAHLGVAEADVLVAARVFTAFIHGYVSMELTGAFRLGANPEVAFSAGLDALWGALVPR